ncbi:uncharacterized protein LOC127735799 [Mytilus californianus]|uniref:uncharacterized protein LOC127735799 n=1 Tax=Mytilus californianus TaxID=6549 RepID=UPI0022472913|nr:uncharacterized protein LOC127735799 [Mytilus californianus]
MSGRGRLSISTALSRNTTLDSSFGGNSSTTSATAAHAERQIKKLKEENAKLRNEIKEVRSLYNQLVQENSHEKFDERRIMLIKSQVIQLERQVLMMSEAISSRSETLAEVENSLTWMTDQWRQYISMESRSPEVPVKRSDLTLMVETAESARIKLYKNIENATVRNLTRPLMFVNEFVRPGSEEEITLLDIASGHLEHLNLKHVAKLETKLASLYKELIGFHSLIEEAEKPSLHPVSEHTNKAMRDHMTTRLLKSCAMIKDCCGDLVQLSLLYPSAPWPPLKRSAIKDLTCDQVMKSLPVLPKTKVKEVQSVIDAMLKAVNYKNSMTNHEIKSLKEDLKFHKSVYDLQLEYIQSLFDAVRGGYQKFEESTKDVIIKPLKDVLKTYGDLKDTASEKALKEFLSCFKQNSEKLENAVEQLSESDDGSEALTQFGEDFFYSLDKLVSKCQRNRDKAVKQRTDLKKEQEQLEQELRNLLDEQELKYREHFVETDRTIINEKRTNKISPQRNNYLNEQNVSKTKSKQSPVSKRETNNENGFVEFPSVEREKSKYIEEDISEQDDENNLKNRNKWNVDTSCPPTFDNMEFIYTNQNNMDKHTGSESETESETASIQEMANAPKESATPTFDSQKAFDVLPPVGLSKQPKKTKRNYVPNLVVPNRTLQLRRSGSLSKMNDTSEQYLQSEPQETNEQLESDGSLSKTKLVRSRSSSKDRINIPQKKPFR